MYRTLNYLRRILAEPWLFIIHQVCTNLKAGVKCYSHRHQMRYYLPETSSSATIWILITLRCTNLNIRVICVIGISSVNWQPFEAMASHKVLISLPYVTQVFLLALPTSVKGSSCTIPLILRLKIVRKRLQNFDEAPISRFRAPYWMSI
jgi:hypothetical protein